MKGLIVSVALGLIACSDRNGYGTEGPATSIAFAAQPGGALAGLSFLVQPQLVALNDSGVQVDPPHPARLEVVTGAGALGGDVTADWSEGSASFVDVSYDLEEAGVVLRAVAGGLQALSDPFDVGAPPPGACQRHDDLFQTRDGGCQDQRTGLAWSKRTAGMSGPSFVWDSTVPGAPAPDEHDYGRTNDYSEIDGEPPCEVSCDTHAAAYCKTLAEGGFSDWRAPALGELLQMISNASLGAPPYLDAAGGFILSSALGQVVDMDTGLVNGISVSTSVTGYCVRGNRDAGFSIAVLDAPSTLGAGRAGEEPLEVGLLTAGGARANVEGVSVTVTSSNDTAWIVAGTTDRTGRVSFDLLLSPGEHTLTASTADFGAATTVVEVGAYPHTCAREDGAFVTGGGGCKHVATLKVWSTIAPTTMSWHHAVWDSLSPAGNSPADAEDGGRSNDYDGDPGSTPDASLINYCHDLVEGGHADWRLPTAGELTEVFTFGAATHFAFDANHQFISATNTENEYVHVNLATGFSRGNDKAAAYNHVVCVRGG